MTANSIQKLTALLLFSIIATQFAHAQAFPWSVQAQLAADPGGTISFRKIDAPDTVHAMALGFGGGNQVVCRTTDGGTTWDQPWQHWAREFAMHDLSHPTPDVAVIVGDTLFIDTGSTIFYTHDGGDTWQQGWCDSCNLPDGARFHLWRVSMCDSINGIMSAYLSCLARTTDGGATWHRITDPTNGQEVFYGLQCLSPSTYIMTTSVYLSGISTIYQTTDSGRTWTHNRVARGTGTPDFIDLLHGWSVGNWTTDSTGYNMVARTTDGGTTWDTLFNAQVPSSHFDNGVYFLSMADATHGIASGYAGTWLYTTDGTTWQYGANLDSVFHVFNITSVIYPHPDKAWATDVLGRILVYQPRTAAVPTIGNVTAAASIAAFPNPITSGAPVSIAITLPHCISGTDRPRLSLIDARGSTVAMIEQPIISSATARFIWSLPAEITTGVYFLRLVDGSTVATIPLTVIH
jgi:photosystem II stability/assembly factor-like uncharacterized protein